MRDHKQSIEDRLQAHPLLRIRIEAILDIVEAPSGHVDTADEAEKLVIDELRRLGNDVLHNWSYCKESQKVAELQSKESKIVCNGKKNSSGTVHTVK